MGLASPNVTILNSTAAHVTWSPPARDNGILLYYEIMRINLESNISKISNNSLHLYVVMTDLEPYNTYQFQVAAITRGGRSWSPETVVTTSEDSKLIMAFSVIFCWLRHERVRKCFSHTLGED